MITYTLQNEFWFHVSPQDEMPIAGEVPQFVDTEALSKIIQRFEHDIHISDESIKRVIKDDINNIDILRALIGISDKRMYLDLSYIFYKTKFRETDTNNILGHSLYNVNSHPLLFFKRKIQVKDNALAEKSLEIISDYLIRGGIKPVLESLAVIGSEQSHILIDKLINAKEAQGALTKRRGHGIEQVFAIFLSDLGISFLPQNRHTNPMARDPNILKSDFSISSKIKNKTWSFDLIITQNELHAAYIQGLIHTSDPGQYGVDKSDATIAIKEQLTLYNEKYNQKRELWGLVDGVGFSENKTNTIDKMLIQFDTFIQLKTIYKSGLRLHQLGLIKVDAISFNSNFYSYYEAQEMFKKYGSSDIKFLYGKEPSTFTSKLIGGMATIYIT
ncbi:hypothetical protein [Peijinzhouia sedimentorum]